MPQLSPNSWKLLMIFAVLSVIQFTILLWWLKSPSYKLYSPNPLSSKSLWSWKHK